jgi:Flp pilus assembly protein TadD
VARDPENPKLLAALGNANYDREDWDGAIEAYRKALRKAPKDANILSDLGAAYRNRGDFKEAIASFQKARAADGDHWQSLLNLVLVNAFDVRDAGAAQRHLDELKRRYPEIPNTDRIQEQISRLRAG